MVIKKIMLVCGARPNFMKMAPLWEELKRHPKLFRCIILHTGQHYNINMSDVFFKDLDLPIPAIFLKVGSGSHAVQTAKIIVEFEKAIIKNRPDLIIVFGDINSTLACSLVAAKLLIPIAHVEAGLRSFDKTMPEEVNRIVTDHLSKFLFTTCMDGNINLNREGISKGKTFFVGNLMIDTLVKLMPKIVESKILESLVLRNKCYAVLTLHRPSNVDSKKKLESLFGVFKKIRRHLPIIFPAHPRTVKQIKEFKIDTTGIKVITPLGYIDFLKLCCNSLFLLTDSGGIQEETTFLNIPCITLRKNTERPITIEEGTNILVGTNPKKILDKVLSVLSEEFWYIKRFSIPKFWDGKAAERIVEILKEKL